MSSGEDAEMEFQLHAAKVRNNQTLFLNSTDAVSAVFLAMLYSMKVHTCGHAVLCIR